MESYKVISETFPPEHFYGLPYSVFKYLSRWEIGDFATRMSGVLLSREADI